jgi:hypothetical protein
MSLSGSSSDFLITAIVPRLPPAVDGLGDHGLSLARHLSQSFGLETQFLVADPAWVNPGLDFAAVSLGDRSRAALQARLAGSERVLLHYVGHGYAPRGCPLWLVQGLEAWRGGGEQRSLVTMFHELYAWGEPFWSSAFWTAPFQRQLTTRLARLSDRCLTNRQESAQKLRSLGHSQPIPALPVFSNVGEPKGGIPLTDREPRAVIFGGIGPRSRVYLRSLPFLEQACHQLGIAEIVDIGPVLKHPLPRVNGQVVKVLGVQPASEISRLLSTSLVGFFDYPLSYLEKSTIFAAYCAHKILPVGADYPGQRSPGIEPGIHFWGLNANQNPIDQGHLQAIADRGFVWYQGHNLQQQAAIFEQLLQRD